MSVTPGEFIENMQVLVIYNDTQIIISCGITGYAVDCH